jgi:hypothetical protein
METESPVMKRYPVENQLIDATGMLRKVWVYWNLEW